MDADEERRQDARLMNVELDWSGPIGSRNRRAQAVLQIAQNAEKAAKQASYAGEPSTTADELLGLHRQVSTPLAKDLVAKAIEYVSVCGAVEMVVSRESAYGLGL